MKNKILIKGGSAWLPQSEDHGNLDLGVMSLSPLLGVEIA